MLRHRPVGLVAVIVLMLGCGRSAQSSAANQAMVEDVAPAAPQPAAVATPAAPSPVPIPYPNTNTATRDVSTGQATGKRMHKPVTMTAQ